MGRWLCTPEGRAHYRRRKSILQPVFGWIKQVLGFRSFSNPAKALRVISESVKDGI